MNFSNGRVPTREAHSSFFAEEYHFAIGDAMSLSARCSSKRRKFSFNDRSEDIEARPAEPSWLSDLSGAVRQVDGPVTASKVIYEDEQSYLIMVNLPYCDHQRVKVSWRNSLTHGIVKIFCVSLARMPYVERRDRTFKLTDPALEHCPPGEFIREIPLATRIPEDAKLEAYYDETGTILEIMVPKHRVGPEEHEVHVCLRQPHPHLGVDELLLT